MVGVEEQSLIGLCTAKTESPQSTAGLGAVFTPPVVERPKLRFFSCFFNQMVCSIQSNTHVNVPDYPTI